MKIKLNDTIRVIAGKEKGKEGKVIKTLAEKSRVVVEGLNMKIKHVKKTAQRAGQKISFEGSMHVSNVMLIDEKTKKPTRVGYKMEKGKKVRFAKKSGAVVETIVSKKKSDAKKSESKSK